VVDQCVLIFGGSATAYPPLKFAVKNYSSGGILVTYFLLLTIFTGSIWNSFSWPLGKEQDVLYKKSN
tara:strand:- start:178 stop:378 length:201 start_codon:yes stop_codon:yes gene_type:complete